MELVDSLKEIFIMQAYLQKRPHIQSMSWHEQVRTNTLALHTELSEALQTLNWKVWRTRPENLNAFQDELIDCMHFLVNLMLLSGMTSEEVYIKYIEKNKINSERMKQ